MILFFLLPRKHARDVRAVANDYVDELLNTARSYVVDNGLSEVPIPNIDASFSKKVSSHHTRSEKL
jgi:hypothetical protein